MTLQVASGFSICDGLGSLPGKKRSCFFFSPSAIPTSFGESGLSAEPVEFGVPVRLAGFAGHSAYGLLVLRVFPGSIPSSIASDDVLPLFAAAAVKRSSRGNPEVAPVYQREVISAAG
jgi:hypothetical protein